MPSSKVSFGIIGCGGIARRRTIAGMLRARNCRLAAVMDLADPQAVADQFGIPRAYLREEDLLADPDVQAVYIASPVHCHAAQIERAARAGKHILCEKPLTLNARQARRAADLCRRRGVLLQEGYMMKFHGAHVRLKELLDAGRLGRLVFLRAQLACWYPPIEGAWRQDPAKGGGGALIDMASHLYDLLEHLAGPVRRIAALTGNLVQGYAPEDAATTLLEFESGAHGVVDSFFCIPDLASRTRLEVYGSRGAVLTEGTIGQGEGGTMEGILDVRGGGYDAGQAKSARGFRPLRFAKVNPYTAECEAFADCILRGQAPAINGPEAAVAAMRRIERAYRSARTHRMERLRASRYPGRRTVFKTVDH